MQAALCAASFEASAQWQTVPEGAAWPRGLEVHFEMGAGTNWARPPPTRASERVAGGAILAQGDEPALATPVPSVTRRYLVPLPLGWLALLGAAMLARPAAYLGRFAPGGPWAR